MPKMIVNEEESSYHTHLLSSKMTTSAIVAKRLSVPNIHLPQFKYAEFRPCSGRSIYVPEWY